MNSNHLWITAVDTSTTSRGKSLLVSIIFLLGSSSVATLLIPTPVQSFRHVVVTQQTTGRLLLQSIPSIHPAQSQTASFRPCMVFERCTKRNSASDNVLEGTPRLYTTTNNNSVVNAKSTTTAAASATTDAPTTNHTTASPATLGSSTMESSSSSSMLSSLSPLNGHDLRNIVLEASQQDDVTSHLDLHGLVWLEHINLIVGETKQAEYFYLDVLGCTRDVGSSSSSSSFHVNLGQQQFHLKEHQEKAGSLYYPPQAITGSIGIVVPSLTALRQRIHGAVQSKVLQGTKFELLYDEDTWMKLRGPWGNIFYAFPVGNDDEYGSRTALQKDVSTDSPQKMTKMHAIGGLFGPRMAVRGQPGIRFVELLCRPGTIPQIADFYRNMLHCTVQHWELYDAITVSVGPGVHLIFAEYDDTLPNADARYENATQAMHGVHLCVYTNEFQELYHRLKNRNLIWTNPRFTHLDTCDTWEEAQASRTLRFRYIVSTDDNDDDNNNNMPLLELEHETRPLRHGQYLKVPCYQPH